MTARRTPAALATLTTLAALAAACDDGGFTRSAAEIDRPRVLAIVAEPAEVEPGEPTTLRALVAAPDGALADAPLDWSICTAPRPLAAATPVAQACLDDAATRIPLGLTAAGAAVPVTVPRDACARFGSEPPPPALDQPPTRAVDPDPTGGYYQPVRAGLLGDDDGAVAIGFVRLRCALPAAPAELARRFAADYAANRNPVIRAARPTASAAAGATVELVVALDAAETYLRYDGRAVQLVDAVERRAVAWFADRGEVDAAVTTLTSEQETATVRWRAPSTSGAAHLWAVARDDRGGLATIAWRIDVE